MGRFDIVDRTMLICSDATAHVVTGHGAAFDAPGIFDNAEVDNGLKREGSNGAGGLDFTKRRPVFTTADRRFADIDKTWRLTIRGKVYFCAEPQADGAGWLTLWLADENGPAPAAPGGGNGPVWR